MPEISKDEYITEEGKTIHIIVSGCKLEENSTLNICPCCCSGGSGNNNGDGDGGGNGDGDGGGNGDGDGGGNDDNKPGDLNITLVGGTGVDAFYDLKKTPAGYVAYGHSATAPGTPILVSFDKDLGFVSQMSYKGGSKTVPLYQLVPGKGGNDWVLPLSGTRTGGQNAMYLMLVGADDKKIKHSNVLGATSTNNMTFSRGLAFPNDFSGSASYIFAAGTTGSLPALVATDSELNTMSTFRLTGGAMQAYGLNVSENKLYAVGQVEKLFNNKHGGFIYRFDDTFTFESVVAFGYETNMNFKFMLNTDYGYLLAGQIVDRYNGNQNILLLGLDKEYNILKRAIVGGEIGDEILDSLDMDAKGNILLCGRTTSIGAGKTDCFVMRLDKDFTLTKELTFGGAGAEDKPCAALFNKDGSVTLAGSTPGAGAGSYDAFIATFKGGWKDLTGGLKKYPNLRINGKPGFKVKETDFEVLLNTNTTLTNATYTPGHYNIVFTDDDTQTLVVDPNAITDI